MADNPLLAFVERYGPRAGARGPELMAEEVFGQKPDEWQTVVFRAYATGVRHISIAACHGPGKTWVDAVLIWHMLLTKFPQKTVATAPSAAQLEDALFAEVMSLSHMLPPALRDLYEFKKNRIELKAAPEDSFFSARTARAESPEALQGVHSEHVLLIPDEASGVPEGIFEAAIGSMSGHSATTIMTSNPTRSTGFFAQSWHKNSDMWFRVRISGLREDHDPANNVYYSPRVSDEFAVQVARTYGEDSNAYRIRVRGLFPKSDDDTIIPWDDIISAQSRDIFVPKKLKHVWGLDVARFGDDCNALADRNALSVKIIDRWDGVDLMQTAGRVKLRWDETPEDERPEEILVDVIGMGAGVVDRLMELGLPVRGVNVSESASVKDTYRNLRTELWFKCRDWLASKDHRIEENEHSAKLAEEMAVLKYKVSSSGKLLAEGKDELKKRGHKSPNYADAVMLTFASEPAGLIHGSNNSASAHGWNQPVRRGRVRV